MSVDLEAGGALATAALAAHEIEARTQSTTDEYVAATCANCKAELVGSYCSRCGQSAHVHRSLWHMIEEVLHGLLHFDTKSWRTIPLLIARPGLLTRRYIEGQRVRYVSPLALFLFCTFMMFFVFSCLPSKASAVIYYCFRRSICFCSFAKHIVSVLDRRSGEQSRCSAWPAPCSFFF
jgi:hypothetical protein